MKWAVPLRGQVSWEVYFNDSQGPDGSVEMARVGPEAVDEGLEPGDRIRLEYLLGNGDQRHTRVNPSREDLGTPVVTRDSLANRSSIS